MKMSLENWLRNKLQENEEMHDYALATDTLRCWIEEYNQLIQPAVMQLVCPNCGTGKENHVQIGYHVNCRECGHG